MLDACTRCEIIRCVFPARSREKKKATLLLSDPRSYDRNFCNCVKKPEKKKFRTSTGLEPVTSRYRCDALPTELWSHWRWEQVNFGFICSRERYEVNDAYEINHIRSSHMIYFICIILYFCLLDSGESTRHWIIVNYIFFFEVESEVDSCFAIHKDFVRSFDRWSCLLQLSDIPNRLALYLFTTYSSHISLKVLNPLVLLCGCLLLWNVRCLFSFNIRESPS